MVTHTVLNVNRPSIQRLRSIMRPIDPPLNYLNFQPVRLDPPQGWDQEKDGECLPIIGLKNDDIGEVCFFWKPTDEEIQDLHDGGSVELTLKYRDRPIVTPMSMATVPRRADEKNVQ